MAKLKKQTHKQTLFEVNTYIKANSTERESFKLFINRDDAISHMLDITTRFEGNTMIEGVKRIQKQNHDLDGYLQCVDLFVDGDHVRLIQLSDYKAY